MEADATSSATSKGQITIPKALRQQLGLARGSRVSFVLVGDHIEVRPLRASHPQPVRLIAGYAPAGWHPSGPPIAAHPGKLVGNWLKLPHAPRHAVCWCL